MLNFVAVSTSAAAAVNALYDEMMEEEQERVMCERAWEERKARIVEGLRYYNIHLKPFWYYYDGEEMLTVKVTRENADALEAEIEAKREQWEEESRETRALLTRLEAHMAAHPEDEETASFYSDVYKDEYGVRPHMRLEQWYRMAHPNDED